MTSNVRDFGAAGNGSNDDTEAFFKAIEAIPVGGGVLYIPAGAPPLLIVAPAEF